MHSGRRMASSRRSGVLQYARVFQRVLQYCLFHGREDEPDIRRVGRLCETASVSGQVSTAV
jgi:hypothetical protein